MHDSYELRSSFHQCSHFSLTHGIHSWAFRSKLSDDKRNIYVHVDTDTEWYGTNFGLYFTVLILWHITNAYSQKQAKKIHTPNTITIDGCGNHSEIATLCSFKIFHKTGIVKKVKAFLPELNICPPIFNRGGDYLKMQVHVMQPKS